MVGRIAKFVAVAAAVATLLIGCGLAAQPRERRLNRDNGSSCAAPALADMCPCWGTTPRNIGFSVDLTASVLDSPRAAAYRELTLKVSNDIDSVSERFAQFMSVSRNEVKLDMFGFAGRGEPIPIENREHLKKVLERGAGSDPWTFLERAVDPVSTSPKSRDLFVILTDAVESRSPVARWNRELCLEWHRDAQAKLETAMMSAPGTDFVIVLPPDEPDDECADYVVGCGRATNCKVSRADGSFFQADAKESLLYKALASAIESHQELPRDVKDAVLLVGDERAHRCTGVLVDERHVLTARHCLPATRVGLDADRVERARDVPVRRTVAHPRLDVALLEIPPQKSILPVERRRATDAAPPVGSLEYVGFGALRANGAGAGARRAVDLMSTGWGCDAGRESTGCIPGEELVLPGVGGADTCFGDSGGPVFELATTGDRCFWRLVGTTSRRVADGHSLCGSGGIYVRTDRIDGWLESQLRSTQRGVER